MSFLGFLGCGSGSVFAFACAAIAGFAQLEAKKKVREVRPAVEQELPDEVGKSIYAARQCFGTLSPVPYLPEGLKSLCCRLTVEKEKERIYSGVGFPIHGKGSAQVVFTPTVDISKRIFGFPSEIILSCKEGSVRSDSLPLAEWKGYTTVKEKLKPKDAVEKLKLYGIKANLNATHYGFTLDFFSNDVLSLTIVGDYTRTEDGYRITPNQQGRPFIASPLSPDELVKDIEEDAQRYKKAAVKCLGVSAVLFMGAHFFLHL